MKGTAQSRRARRSIGRKGRLDGPSGDRQSAERRLKKPALNPKNNQWRKGGLKKQSPHRETPGTKLGCAAEGRAGKKKHEKKNLTGVCKTGWRRENIDEKRGGRKSSQKKKLKRRGK